MNDREKSSLPLLLALTGICAAGILIRIYRLGAESVWFDEFTSVMHLDAPTLLDFLRRNRSLDPATFPLYYVIEYGFWKYIAASVYGLRLVSVALGVLSILLIYLLGRDIAGRPAGLFAALCLALSPIHAFHAQGIRMYAVFVPLALFSAWAWLRWRRDARSRWFCANIAANALLVWTHPFAVLLPMVEGLTLLVSLRRHNWRPFAVWVAAHAGIMLTIAVYAAGSGFWDRQSTDQWMKTPTPTEMLGDLFADDVISMTWQMRAEDPPFNLLPLHTARPFMDWAAALFFPLLAGLAIWRARMSKETAFLVLWLLVPPLLLYFLSLAWRPCIFPRYTLHCAFALYLLGGIAVEQVRPLRIRVALFAVAFALLGFQLCLLLPGPQRTDWRGAVRALESQKAAQDLVLVLDPLWMEVLQLNADLMARRNAVEPIATGVLPEQVVGIAERYLWADPSQAATAWIVVQLDYYASGSSRPVEDALAKCPGIAFIRQELPGFQHLCLYRLTREAQTPPCAGYECPPDQIEPFVDDLCFAATAVAYAGDSARAGGMFKATLNLGVDPQPKYMHLVKGIETGATDVKERAQAVRALTEAYNWKARRMLPEEEDALRRAVQLDAGLPAAWQDLGLCLTKQGRYPEAAAAFGKGMEADPMLRINLGGVAKAVAAGDKNRVDRAFQSAEIINAAVYQMATGAIPDAMKSLEDAVALDDANTGALMFKGLLMAENGDTAGGLEAFRRVWELDETLGARLRLLVEALYARNDLDTARTEIIKLGREGFSVPDLMVRRAGMTIQELNDLVRVRP